MKFVLSTALLMLACAGTCAIAAPSGEQTVTSTAPRNFVTTNEQGQVVVLDRSSGSARALTPAEAQRLAEGIMQLANKSTEGLVQVQHADGSVSMDLAGRFQDVMLAKKNADGSIEQACVDDPALAASFFEIDPALVSAATAAVSRASAEPPIR